MRPLLQFSPVVLVLLVGLGLLAQTPGPSDDNHLRVHRGANDPANLDNWLKSENLGNLEPYPVVTPGTPNPDKDLRFYGGRGVTSFGSPDLGMPFEDFYRQMSAQKPSVDKAAHDKLERRYDLTCRADASYTMSRGKRQPMGPAARLPKGMSWEQLAELSPEETRSRDIFPFKPLDHPLQSTAHMVFPSSWTAVHPEEQRIDVSHDLPDCFLPEFPPAMYLTTHPELGDVSRGVEITYANYFRIFNGLLTPEQLEGLRLLLTPFQTTWFNTTPHRVTKEPSLGVSCFSCHVNGHTNGAFELAPDSRPNYNRLRMDTPSLRGNYCVLLFSSKRSIRSMDHFAEVEEYFDGDQTMLAAIGGRNLQQAQTNHIGDFSAIIDFPPAPKLDPLGRLIAKLATDQELRGEEIFRGKGHCASCHPPEHQFVDQDMHNLAVERFYMGRAEGPVKTFSLRGIKDSPPYFHDGRLPTLEDAVEFFNIVMQCHLSQAEKCDLTAYLRAL